jgi:hypothetical protein
VGDRVLFDLSGQLAQLFPFGDAVGALVALGPDEPESLVVPVGVRVVGDEGVGGGWVFLGFHAMNLQAMHWRTANVQMLTAKDAKDAKGKSDFNVRTADECECTQIE